MSDPVVQSDHGSDESAGKSVPPYQSAWMAHWKLTSSKSATQACNELSLNYASKQGNHDTMQQPISEPEILNDSSKISQGFREMTETRTVNIMNESLTSSSKKFKKEILECQPFPMFNLSGKGENILVLKDEQVTFSHGDVRRSQIDHSSGYNTVCLSQIGRQYPSMLTLAPPETKTSSRECYFQPEGTSWKPEQLMKYYKFSERNSASVSVSDNDFMGSTSGIVPYGHKREEIPVQFFMHRQEDINESTSVLASKQHFTDTNLTHLEHGCSSYHSCSAFMVNEKKIDNPFKSSKYGTSSSQQNNVAQLLHDPSTSNSLLPDFVGNQFQKMPNHSVNKVFPNQSSPPVATKSENLRPRWCSLPRVRSSDHDVETTRISTTVDTAEDLSGRPPKFSQTTRHLLIKEKSDIGLSEGCQMFQESTVSSTFKGKGFSELLSLSPDFGFKHQQGVKLELLGSSTDSEGKENARDVKISAVGGKNESSAETDTMDLDALQENNISGVDLSLSNKDIKGAEISPVPKAGVASATEEVGGRVLNRDLPDMNQELPALPGVSSAKDDKELSFSKTLSLDVEHLLAHAEQPTNSKSNVHPNGSLGLDPSSRWVKRLKPNASNSFSRGTKSSKIGEASSHEKHNKYFSKIMKCSMPSSESIMDKSHGKELMVIDQTAVPLSNSDPSYIDSVRRNRDMILSQSWIRRWCRNHVSSPQKTPEAGVCVPPSSNAAADEFKKKQFPSVAAMALMGKAMNGFRPCEFRKGRSFVVWNTKGF